MSKVLTDHGFIEVDNNYLAHHGILGMHWGIRRFQKYGEGGYNPKHKGKFTGKKKSKKSESKSSKERKRLTDTQKKILIAAGVTAVAAVGAYAVYKSGVLNKVGLGKNIVYSGIDNNEAVKIFGKVSPDHQSWTTQISKVGSKNLNKHDCGPGSMALLESMKKDGLSLKAKDVTRSTTWDDVAKLYPNMQKPTKTVPSDNFGDIGDWCKNKFGESGSGLVGLTAKESSKASNHFISARVENGKTIFMDQQVVVGNLKGLEFSADGSYCTLGGKDFSSKGKLILDKYNNQYNLDLTDIVRLDNTNITNDMTILSQFFETRK